MRKKLMATLCTALAFPVVANAQPGAPGIERKSAPAPTPTPADDPSESVSSDEGSETQGADVVDEPKGKGKVKPDGEGRDAAPGEVHTVLKGDTLWDLSQRYLGSAWYWPKVWSYNPEIANPHWIYPGNLVRFFPGGEEVPSRVEVGEAPPVEGGAPIGDEDVMSSDMIPSEVDSTVQVSSPIGYKPKPASRILHEGFVTPRELEESGIIDSSYAETEMLSAPDTVYLRFRKQSPAKLGDQYVIFRTEQKVEHPVNGKSVGYLTKFLGMAKVIRMGKTLVTAQIVETWDPIERGDMVGPFGEKLAESIALRPNDKGLKGYIVSALIPQLSVYGEHHFVIIDRGSSDGVMSGNTFTVIRQQDRGGDFLHPEKVENDELPVEDVGACMAVDVKEKASTCLMVRSLREVVAGDRVEMRAQPASAPVSSR